MFSATMHLFADWCRDETDGIDEVVHSQILEDWDCRVVRALFNVQLDALSEGGVANEMVAEIESNVSAGKATFLDEFRDNMITSRRRKLT